VEAVLLRSLNSMLSFVLFAGVVAGSIAGSRGAFAQDSFPFDQDLTLDATPMRGSKRVPSLQIGPNGDVIVELWCKGTRGQFAVANDTVIYVPGPVEDRNCPADRAQADDAVLAALADVATWQWQGDVLVLAGSRQQLRFRLNTN
jgi:hypothetical protein